MLLRWLTFVVWALVAGSGVYWGTKLLARPLPVPAQAAVAVPGLVSGGDLTRLFGVAPAPVQVAAAELAPVAPESSRFQLLGVVAAPLSAARAQGVALIAVDGKIARAYRVGARVDGDLVLQSVQAREVTLGPRGSAALVSLELPGLPAPATGVPTGAVSPPAAPAMPLPRPVRLAPEPALPQPALQTVAPPALQPVMPAPQALPAPPTLNAPGPGRQRAMRSLNTPVGVLQVPGTQSEEGEAHAPAPQFDGRSLR